MECEYFLPFSWNVNLLYELTFSGWENIARNNVFQTSSFLRRKYNDHGFEKVHIFETMADIFRGAIEGQNPEFSSGANFWKWLQFECLTTKLAPLWNFWRQSDSVWKKHFWSFSRWLRIDAKWRRFYSEHFLWLSWWEKLCFQRWKT